MNMPRFFVFYKVILIATVLAGLLFFIPLYGWPNITTWGWIVLLPIFTVFLAIRTFKIESSARKLVFAILLLITVISVFTFIYSAGTTLYHQLTTPNISQDDFASMDWILPLILGFIVLLVLSVVMLSEVILMEKTPRQALLMKIGISFIVLWLVLWLLSLQGFRGFLLFPFMIIGVLINLYVFLRGALK